MKTLLFEDKKRIENENYAIKNDLPVLNKLNAFLKEIGTRLTRDMIRCVISNPETLIRNIIKDRIPSNDPNTGLKNNKDRHLEGMELPRINGDLIRLLDIIDKKDRLQLFDFGDEVTLNEDRLQKYMDKRRVFADSTEILEAFEELNAVAERLNKLNEKLEFMPITPYTFGSSEYFFKSLSETFSITPEGLRLEAAGFQWGLKSVVIEVISRYVIGFNLDRL